MPGDGSASDPKKLEGNSEDSRPREFFWDSITLYVVGVIVGLAAIDAITEFIRGSSTYCNSENINEDFVNNYCSASIPRTEYFPAFIAVHAILIAIPHYLWANHYGGNFEFFFTQCKEMDRIRSEDTGYYSDKNYIIVEQLTRAFSTYRQNLMFVHYAIKLFLQLVITLTGFFLAIFYFTDFKDVFICPQNMDNTTFHITDPLWPLNTHVTCVFTSLRLFATIRIADLILLALLILCFMWSLTWCVLAHPTELGTGKVATFSFQSNISPSYHLSNSPLQKCCGLRMKLCHLLCMNVPFCGAGPYIGTNLDFLMLKLFRTDSGLGFVFREMQVLRQIKHLNDDDQRVVNLHKLQQRPKNMEDGDIISTRDIQGYDHDIKWNFTKKAGEVGLYNAPAQPHHPDDTLELPRSLRGVILGFSSLAAGKKRAMFITFGSTSLGIPSALIRVFSKVGVVNFNPYFKKQGDNDQFCTAKIYCSEIIELNFPEDILSAENKTYNDFVGGLNELWTDTVKTIDFIVIAPVENKLHLSTLSLCLTTMAFLKFINKAILLTVKPKEIGAKNTSSEFFHYDPPRKYFVPLEQRVYMSSKRVTEINWPPKNDGFHIESKKSSHFNFQIPCGHTDSRFEFELYQYKTTSSRSAQQNQQTEIATEVTSVEAPLVMAVR